MKSPGCALILQFLDLARPDSKRSEDWSRKGSVSTSAPSCLDWKIHSVVMSSAPTSWAESRGFMFRELSSRQWVVLRITARLGFPILSLEAAAVIFLKSVSEDRGQERTISEASRTSCSRKGVLNNFFHQISLYRCYELEVKYQLYRVLFQSWLFQDQWVEEFTNLLNLKKTDEFFL